ncbi:putative disease resistance protein RGA3 isoform X2 [Ziziphus jujuba]|uniref:Disease resistance protein RGA3 isoform X2 n=1 Tax=Ziziphus jujuba TaxID=326968 RepID=A0ABM4A334_ZIZJJ|nr:putative disease resistance protein RGA3 isoform X2 [Ziziphus jujuba]
MAESILFGVAERIIGTLATSAVQETGLLWGVNEELSGLEDTISLIKAVLVDAEEKKAHNHHVKAWLTRLEDVVYEADDLLDEFSAEDLRQQILGSTGSEMTKMTLLQRCQKDKGEDWPKIAHIPNLQFEFVDDSQSSAASGHKWKIFKNFRVPHLCKK